MRILKDGKGLIIGDEYINLNDYPDLKVIGCPMTGLDHLPVEEIKARGIKLISLKDYPHFLKGVASTSEHAFGLIIALLRHYKTALKEPYLLRETYMGHTLAGKTLGIIGYGRVGKQMKEIAKGFKMNVLTHDLDDDYKPSLLSRLLGPGELKQNSNLEYLLRNSDIVSIHIPLPGNEGFFNEAMFGFMKQSAVLINTSRSKVVEEGALLDALRSGIIAGAAVDFVDDEQLRNYATFANNILLTNHIGGMTFEDRKRTDAFILQAVVNFINDNKI